VPFEHEFVRDIVVCRPNKKDDIAQHFSNFLAWLQEYENVPNGDYNENLVNDAFDYAVYACGILCNLHPPKVGRTCTYKTVAKHKLICHLEKSFPYHCFHEAQGKCFGVVPPYNNAKDHVEGCMFIGLWYQTFLQRLNSPHEWYFYDSPDTSVVYCTEKSTMKNSVCREMRLLMSAIHGDMPLKFKPITPILQQPKASELI
jgi:hypothetical protein